MSSESSNADRSEPRPRSAERQLDVLGNGCSRTILVAARERSRTARELTELTDCSSATVYRRLNDLMQEELIEECVRFDEDGSHTTAYRSVVARVEISIEPAGMRVSTVPPEDGDGASPVNGVSPSLDP